MTATRQLPLALGHHQSYDSADFLVADSNREAVAWIGRWPEWPAPALVIYGPEGCGKTHLLRLLGDRATVTMLDAGALGGGIDPTGLLADTSLGIVDDADRTIAAVGEETVLHLYNVVHENRGHLLLAGRTPPSRWPITLADLRSRLNAALVVGIGAPDDSLLAQLLVKHFRDRQLRVEPEVISFLVPRIERSAAAAQDIVAALDATALGQQRRVTIGLAREMLQAATNSAVSEG